MSSRDGYVRFRCLEGRSSSRTRPDAPGLTTSLLLPSPRCSGRCTCTSNSAGSMLTRRSGAAMGKCVLCLQQHPRENADTTDYYEREVSYLREKVSRGFVLKETHKILDIIGTPGSGFLVPMMSRISSTSQATAFCHIDTKNQYDQRLNQCGCF
jgi:hypothetical protein